MRKYLTLVLFLVPTIGRAACTGSSPTWTTTPDSASVTTCLTNAARNDTINVSAGSATWTSAVTITKGVTLTGAGAGSTIITNGAGNVPGVGVLEVTPDATSIANSSPIKISGFTWDGGGNAYYVVHVNGAPYNGTKPYRNIIITNNTFQNTGSIGGNGNTCLLLGGELRGVVSGNTFDKCDFPFRVFGTDDTREWSNPAYTYSYGSADNLYIESNTIKFSTPYTSNEVSAGWVESGQGARWVVRFNTWDLSNATGQSEFWDIHGNQNFLGGGINGQTGTMVAEFYRNTISNASSAVYRWIDHRGGWGMFFDNTLGVASTPDIEVNQYAIPPDSRAGCYPYILNPDSSQYTGPDGTVANTYFINNTVNAAVSIPGFDNTVNNCGVVENGHLSSYGTGVVYGWWAQHPTFTGATGVGRGPIASRPATCTTGVGYWATDQGSWNISGSGGQGVFYKCTATNTWTLYYTPYTYPNPLLGAPPTPTIPVTFFDMNNDTRTGAGAYPTFPIGGIRLWNPTPTGTGWAASQTGPSTYDFTQLNARLSDAPAGVDIMLTMGCSPNFIASSPGSTTPCQGNTLMSASLPSDVASGDTTWKGYITHLVNDSLAQAHHIKFYEMNNEADLTQYCFNGAGLGNTNCTTNAANVVTMVQDAYTIIHSLDPNALVVSPTGSTTCTNNCGVHFLPAFFAAGGAPYIDIVGMHSYLFNVPVGGQFSNVPEQITNVISQLRTLMTTYSITALPLWFTEGSWGGTPNNTNMTDAQKIAYVMRDYLLMYVGGVSRFYWYAYGNSAWGTLSNGSGVLTAAGTAYSNLDKWLVGATYSPGNCVQNGSLTWTCNLLSSPASTGPAEIIWNPTTTQSVSVSSIYTQVLNGDGSVTPISGSVVTAGPEPVMAIPPSGKPVAPTGLTVVLQ